VQLFKSLRLFVFVELMSPVVRICCSMCLTDLYIKLLNHNIALVTYDAEIAGIRFVYFNRLHLIRLCVCVCMSYVLLHVARETVFSLLNPLLLIRA